MSCAIPIAITCIFVRIVQSGVVGDEGTLASVTSDPFDIKERNGRLARKSERNEEALSPKNNWGFSEGLVEWPEEDEGKKEEKTTEGIETTTQYYEEVDPNHNGLLKDIGSINVGFGVGVGVPGNDPVSVGARVGVGFGASGLAGQLRIGQNIYPRQVPLEELSPRLCFAASKDINTFSDMEGAVWVDRGEWQSLNDYDGNKANIVPDKARKYWQGVRDGTIKVPHYRPAKSLVGVGGNIGVGG